MEGTWQCDTELKMEGTWQCDAELTMEGTWQCDAELTMEGTWQCDAEFTMEETWQCDAELTMEGPWHCDAELTIEGKWQCDAEFTMEGTWQCDAELTIEGTWQCDAEVTRSDSPHSAARHGSQADSRVQLCCKDCVAAGTCPPPKLEGAVTTSSHTLLSPRRSSRFKKPESLASIRMWSWVVTRPKTKDCAGEAQQ
jgi:hypothetical protein